MLQRMVGGSPASPGFDQYKCHCGSIVKRITACTGPSHVVGSVLNDALTYGDAGSLARTGGGMLQASTAAAIMVVVNSERSISSMNANGPREVPRPGPHYMMPAGSISTTI